MTLLLKGSRIRAINRDRRRKADRALVSKTTAELLAGLRKQGKARQADSIARRVG